MNGILNVYKEKDFTSFDVVAKLRGILKQKKIGHTGTLDPNATGVLPICLGNATKIVSLLTEKDKEYITTFILGKETDTQDLTGKVLKEIEVLEKNQEKEHEEGKVYLSKEEVITCINSFLGKYMQEPPMYSAKKVAGKKLVDLARKGVIVEREKVEVNIKELEILEVNIPIVKMRILCSKGTYIRTLCSDIGNKLLCGASMLSLERTKVDRFLIKDSLKIDDIIKLKEDKNLFLGKLIKVDEYFDFYKKLHSKKEFDKLLLNGHKLNLNQVLENVVISEKDYYRLYTSEDKFIGIYSYDKENITLKPYKLFIGGN